MKVNPKIALRTSDGHTNLERQWVLIIHGDEIQVVNFQVLQRVICIANKVTMIVLTAS